MRFNILGCPFLLAAATAFTIAGFFMVNIAIQKGDRKEREI
jgi:hypothetical protein